MSPRSDLFEIAADYYTPGPEMRTLDESLSKAIPQDIVPLYPEASFVVQSHDFMLASQSLLDFGYEAQPPWTMDSVLTASPPLDVDSCTAPGDVTSIDGMGVLDRSASSSLLVAPETSPIERSPKDASVGPAEADFRHYCERLLSSPSPSAPVTDPFLSISISHHVSVTCTYRTCLDLDVRGKIFNPDPGDASLWRTIRQVPNGEGLCISDASQHLRKPPPGGEI
jgi:hypothetical protein